MHTFSAASCLLSFAQPHNYSSPKLLHVVWTRRQQIHAGLPPLVQIFACFSYHRPVFSSVLRSFFFTSKMQKNINAKKNPPGDKPSWFDNPHSLTFDSQPLDKVLIWWTFARCRLFANTFVYDVTFPRDRFLLKLRIDIKVEPVLSISNSFWFWLRKSNSLLYLMLYGKRW